ncbi:MAG: MFS transporter [Pseudomonadota bacterium]
MRLFRLALVGSVAILPLLVLPTVVGALVDYAGLTESQAGWAAAASGAGSALAAILIALRIRHLDRRKLAIVGLAVLFTFDLLSALVGSIPMWLFIVIRGIAGIGGAAAYAAVMASYAEMDNSERGYGLFMVLQFAISAIGLYWLPYILPTIGISGLYVCLAAIVMLAFTQVGTVPGRPDVDSPEALEIRTILAPAAILAMLGIGLFETANNMHFTYAERIGVGFEIGHERVGAILGIVTVIGMFAAYAVFLIGDRFGELKPILACLAVAIVALLCLDQFSGEALYFATMTALSVAWAFGLPYFQAFEARLDPGGSVVVAGGLFTAAGGALGPALAATAVAPGNYSAVLLLAAGIYVITALIMTVASRL